MGYLGQRAVPFILKILQDESLRSKLAIPTGKDLFPEAPIDRICELLENYPVPECVGPLSTFLDEPSEPIRKSVLLVIGSAGRAECVEPLRKGFSDSDEYVRASALIGLKRAVKAKRLDEICKRDLFSDLEQLITAEKNTGDATNFAARIRPETSGRILPLAGYPQLEPEIIVSRFGRLGGSYNCRPSRAPSFPRRRVRRKEAGLRAGAYFGCGLAPSWPAPGSRGSRFARSADDECRGTRRDRRGGGPAGEPRIGGLRKASLGRGGSERILRAFRPEKYFSAVRAFDGEACGEGLSSYFYYSDADQWKEALAGFQAMGFKERTAILREAIAKFGRQGPPVDSKARQRLLDSLAEKDAGLFEELGERYYKSSEIIEVFAARYVIKNADAFK